jgi:hypothetical protein
MSLSDGVSHRADRMRHSSLRKRSGLRGVMVLEGGRQAPRCCGRAYRDMGDGKIGCGRRWRAVEAGQPS